MNVSHKQLNEILQAWFVLSSLIQNTDQYANYNSCISHYGRQQYSVVVKQQGSGLPGAKWKEGQTTW